MTDDKIIDPQAWKTVREEDRMNKGPLVRIDIGHGRSVKMYEADAIARGYIPGKAKPQAENKLRQPPANKAEEPAQEQPPEMEADPADDLTQIQGIGPATARALAVHGITTFAQLKGAGQLPFLTDKLNQAIEEWRNG